MKRRRPWVWLLRGTVGAGVLAYLLWQSRSGAVGEALRALNGPRWTAAVALYLVGQLLCAWKWGVLTRALGMPRPYRALVAYYCGGMFFNLFLPTTVGGDVGRAAALARPNGTLARGLISVLADRGSGFIALLLLASVAVLVLPGLPAGIVAATVAGTALAVAGSAAALAAPGCFRRLGEGIHDALVACRRPRVLLPVAAVSLLFQVLAAVVHALVGWALGLEVGFGYYLLAGTLGAIVAMAPVSVNGLGTRDAAYVFLLGLGGMPREAALAFALSWLALILTCGAVGGLVFALLAPGQASLFRATKSAAATAGEDGDG
ncbi:MAG: flippase-like domain-containing protein [Armatimonadetes bacterium]|nr:flippase-like domain-containing protein [Armatimonadota bacterium]